MTERRNEWRPVRTNGAAQVQRRKRPWLASGAGHQGNPLEVQEKGIPRGRNIN